MENLDRLETLEAILDRLREPGGCPWDREQTYSSLRGYLLEESYEALDALDRVEEDDGRGLKEELGDLLLQIVFLSRLAKEQGRFRLADVVLGISKKMVRRHPHVFGDESAKDPAEVLVHWERIKREEKSAEGKAPESVLDGLPAALPPMLRAQRLGTKAARVGFDWDSPAAVLEKVREEFDELSIEVKRGDRDAAQAELGDLLFSLIMLARKLKIEPEAALESTNRKFVQRFHDMERTLSKEGRPIDAVPAAELEELWNRAKER